eukprot:Skav218634  [mRNA]  locus=scaffold365:221048:221632:+ [translate_table: standard]
MRFTHYWSGSIFKVRQLFRYVIVRYKFDVDVDDTRKETFRAAAADWRTHTCIAVIEDDAADAWRDAH